MQSREFCSDMPKAWNKEECVELIVDCVLDEGKDSLQFCMDTYYESMSLEDN